MLWFGIVQILITCCLLTFAFAFDVGLAVVGLLGFDSMWVGVCCLRLVIWVCCGCFVWVVVCFGDGGLI